jgi:Domain of unknown function (DUF4252)
MKTLFQNLLKLPLLVTVLFLPSIINAQDPKLQLAQLDHLAGKANETVDVSIDERLMQMAAKLLDPKDEDEAQIKQLVAGLKGIYVKSFEFDNENEYTAADVELIKSQLRQPSWSRLVYVTSKKEGNVEVYISMTGQQVNGLAVLSVEPKELTVVNIVGPVDIEKLAKLEGRLGIPELGIHDNKQKKNEQ